MNVKRQTISTRTEAIQAFLNAFARADLAALYTHDMECQVNVAQDGGERITGEFHGRTWQGYTDGIQTWKSFRIPRNANTVPEFDDVPMRFSLEEHAEAVGMTGWDWRKKLSRWVAFDFDAITGHSVKHIKKLTAEELDKIRESLSGVPWVTLRTSSGGKGLHVYVFIEPTLSENHTYHAALARAILGKLSALVGYDFETKVDACGSNMWIWHRKSQAVDGLSLIQQGEILRDIPLNWKDHVRVITGHQKRTVPKELSEAEQAFNDLMCQAPRIPLDEQHRLVIKWLEENGTRSWWDADHHMLVTHTYYLNQAHKSLALRGMFETLAAGTEAPNDTNAYMFPVRDGAWSVRRYTRGVAEHASWDQDGRGWTRTYFNRDPDLAQASRLKGGLESESGAFVFTESESAAEALRLLGAVAPELPLGVRGAMARLKMHKDGLRAVMTIEGDKMGAAAGQLQGWLHDRGKWSKIFPIKHTTTAEPEVSINGDQIRHVINEIGDDGGWLIKREDDWSREPLVHIMRALESMGFSQKDVKNVIGGSVVNCWKLVNRPFQPEYLGEKLWNRDAAQFKVIPSQHDNLSYPTWLLILQHIGAGLDDAVRANPWAKANNILTGADYLKLWIASLFKEPTEPLPYLFLHGDQNSGKSILHEALSLLMTKGYRFANIALTSQAGFNEELQSAILCAVEEIDLRTDKNAANKMKDLVTARQINIHGKGKTPFHCINTTHWMQVANNVNFCPIFPGDSRITMIHVGNLDPIDRIPKKLMIPKLEAEAPDFLAEILRLEIPPSNDRLNVPVIVTAEKAEAERANQTPVQMFLSERCYHVTGEWIALKTMYDRFIETAESADVAWYTKPKFTKELPPHYPKGRNPKDGQFYIGNISFEAFNGGVPKPKLKATPPDDKGNVYLLPERPPTAEPNGQHD